MTTHHIPLAYLLIKSQLRNGETGKVTAAVENGVLRMVTLVEGLSKKHQNYAYIDRRFKLPFRIDIVLMTNSPEFKLRFGRGHVMFTGSLNRKGFGIRRADILTGREETTKNDYDNVLPINEYVEVSIIYGSKTTWIKLNGRHCYQTGKAPYIGLMESGRIPAEYANGLDFAIACGAGVELMIKSLSFTEYDNDEPVIHHAIASYPELTAYEWYIKSLPHEVRDEAVATDMYLMNDMNAIFKFRKSIDKDGKLLYESPCGLRYSMNRYGIGESHAVSWDKLGRVLDALAGSSPEFAGRMFENIDAGVSSRGGEKCAQCSTIDCANMKITEFGSEKRRSCGGAMQFKWRPADFADLRKLIAAAKDIVKMNT
jgi:hypothetical protein